MFLIAQVSLLSGKEKMPPVVDKAVTRTLSLRFSLACLALAISTCAGLAANANTENLDKVVRPFFAEHCTNCHGEKKQKGDLRVDNLLVDFESPKIMGHWEEIMNRINSGDMPPEEKPRPKPDDIARIAEWIAGQLREAETTKQASGGERVAFHKLTRDEYANTIRDLLGVNFDVKGPGGLPEDPDWKGFERIGSVLTLSPAHVEKYLAAADAILDEALSIRPEPKRETVHWGAFDLRWKGFQKEYEARGIADQVRIEIVPNNYTTDTWNVEIKTTGDYLLRMKLSGLRAQGGRAPRLKVYLSSVDKTLIEQDVDAPEDQPITIEARVHLIAGKYPVRIINSVPGPNGEGRRSRHSGTANAFTNTRSRVPWQLKLTDDDFKPIQPTLIVDSVDWEGPLEESWPTAAHQQIFFGGEKAARDAAYAREIVTRFAERAWRRTVQPAEVDRLLKPFEQAQQLGDNFELSVKGSLVAVLCAKSFLYLEEGNVERPAPKLSDWELASRLSFFLWSTMPDQHLLDLARTGKLHETATLRAEVHRMLADPKAAEFAESFPRQWLQLRRVGMFPPDKVLYPEYDENLEESMIGETVGYFADVLKRNGKLREFLDSDWTLLNERLATHYGFPGIVGEKWQRVSLKPEDHRGGLLTQGAILSLTSDGTRHRPVHRGVWMLESIIGKPPPPPPANVPALNTPAANAPKTTVREKLEAHRSDPNCTACHKKIDPLGLAFDNYDAIGRWRTIETVRDGTGADPKLDPSGELPDGRTFADGAELKRLLVHDIDRFAAAFTEKLATYALRRGMTFTDREELKHVVENSKASDYPLASLVESLATSELFQKR
jgi:mono/diheme cytochrome c family protein